MKISPQSVRFSTQKWLQTVAVLVVAALNSVPQLREDIASLSARKKHQNISSNSSIKRHPKWCENPFFHQDHIHSIHIRHIPKPIRPIRPIRPWSPLRCSLNSWPKPGKSVSNANSLSAWVPSVTNPWISWSIDLQVYPKNPSNFEWGKHQGKILIPQLFASEASTFFADESTTCSIFSATRHIPKKGHPTPESPAWTRPRKSVSCVTSFGRHSERGKESSFWCSEWCCQCDGAFGGAPNGFIPFATFEKWLYCVLLSCSVPFFLNVFQCLLPYSLLIIFASLILPSCFPLVSLLFHFFPKGFRSTSLILPYCFLSISLLFPCYFPCVFPLSP